MGNRSQSRTSCRQRLALVNEWWTPWQCKETKEETVHVLVIPSAWIMCPMGETYDSTGSRMGRKPWIEVHPCLAHSMRDLKVTSRTGSRSQKDCYRRRRVYERDLGHLLVDKDDREHPMNSWGRDGRSGVGRVHRHCSRCAVTCDERDGATTRR